VRTLAGCCMMHRQRFVVDGAVLCGCFLSISVYSVFLLLSVYARRCSKQHSVV
jgi:uncharacterized membrane protein